MANGYGLLLARTSTALNPFTTTIAVTKGDGIVVLIKGVGGTNRAGGSLTLGPYTLTQRNSTQKAATSPEASAELWDVLNADPGSYTLTVPNTGPITLKITVVRAIPAAGGRGVTFLGANGGNNTSTNPTPGAVGIGESGAIGFAITAGGWTTWAPSAQVGTVIANTDDGADGGGEQYILNPAQGSHTLSWTNTSDDWGAVSSYYGEIPPTTFNNYLRVGSSTG